ncbi:MAG TPA: Gfo/Idh/MocA family oxidoreductase [Planctomycetota bacterium]|nr:Gfo/Idh/MocA family oxidoreductase [Planctomycetota bacterium]
MSDSQNQSGPVRVAVAGLGRAGWNIHVEAMRKLPDLFRVTAVLDGVPERRAEAERELGCRAYERYDDLLADRGAELVVVAAPTQLHADWTVAALSAGRHVLCEKPMARDLAECDRMIAAEKQSGRTLSIFQNRRFSPSFLKMRQVAASGVLGRIVMVRAAVADFRRRWDWQTVRSMGGGMLRNYGAHRIDQLMEFSGPAEPAVHCRLDRVLASGDAEDFVRLSMSAPDAPLLEVDIFMNCAFDLPEWLVLGDRGTLLSGPRGNSDPMRWKVVRGFDALPGHRPDLGPAAGREYSTEKLAFDEFQAVPNQEFEDSDLAYYRALHGAIRGGRPAPVSSASVRRRMLVIEQAAREQAGLR